jgi:hypothetical protein
VGKLLGSGNGCLSEAARGWRSTKACIVCSLSSAGRSSDSIIRIAALMLPSSILDVTKRLSPGRRLASLGVVGG